MSGVRWRTSFHPIVRHVDLSVIVCTFNRSAMLRGNLAALHRQKVALGLKWEVIVVDNNCTDDTAEIVRQAAVGFPVELRRVEENKQGLCNARNRGIAESRARYIAFTDDDTRPEPEWVEQVWRTFEMHNCDAVAGRVELIWPKQRPMWLIDDLLSSLAHVDYGPQVRTLMRSEEPFLGANMSFRREVFVKIGIFNPDLDRTGKRVAGGGDTDVFERLLRAGSKIVYQPRASVLHILEPERVRKNYFRRLYFYGGQVYGLKYNNLKARMLIGVPLFGIRQLAASVHKFASSALSVGENAVFKQELNIWWHCGFITGCFKRNSNRESA
jgi:glycosyltransferase involved in cell wall biosynthesis